jgi:hypothetical protein
VNKKDEKSEQKSEKNLNKNYKFELKNSERWALIQETE